MRSVRSLALAAVLAVLAGLSLTAPASAAYTPPGLSGPDVASYQHPKGASIDWVKVRQDGRRWGFVKATEGITYKNPYFADDWRAISAAGLYRGTYHYARPTTATGNAEAQAREFANTIGSQQVPGTLPPILDLEDAGGLAPAALISWTTRFLTTLASETGRVPMLYTYPSFWKNQMANSTEFTQYPLWIANYGATNPPTFAWGHWTFWQYTSSGTVDGIQTPGATDISVFNGTALDLAALAIAGTWGPAKTTASDSGNQGGLSRAPVNSRYVALPATRFADTRSGQGGTSGPVKGTATFQLPATVPVNATGVVLDVTAVDPRGTGWLRVSPSGTAPTTTALNFVKGHGYTGLVVTAADATGRIDITTYGGITDLVGDVVGYYTSASGTGGHWSPLDPSRVVDTRIGKGGVKGQQSGSVTFTLPDSVPADAIGVALDVTAVDPANDGYLRLSPTGTPASTTALNFQGGGSTTGLALTKATNRQVTVDIAGAVTNLVVDLIGYYEGSATSGSEFVAATPSRVVDTRTGLGATGPGSGPLSVTLPAVVPRDATAALLDVSVVGPDGRGYVRLAAPGTAASTTAINMIEGQSSTGLVLTGIRDGQLTLAVFGASTDLVIDLIGYQTSQTPPSASPSPSPSAS